MNQLVKLVADPYVEIYCYFGRSTNLTMDIENLIMFLNLELIDVKRKIEKLQQEFKSL